MNVYLWGFYSEGNFGDDAMGYLIAKELSMAGHRVTVFGISPDVIADLSAHPTNSLREISSADLVVLGGGGFLTDSSILRGLLHGPTRIANSRISQLASALKQSGKSIVPISIGGDGSPISRLKQRLLQCHATAGTVRLDSDLATLSAANIEGFAAFADILWLLPDYIRVITPRDREFGPQHKPVIGLNIKKKSWEPELEAVINRLRTDIEFKFLRSHIDVLKYSYECGAPEGSVDYTGSIAGYLQQIANCDMIVSSKLHVGISAMGFGVPFLSYKGPEKARRALIEIGLEHHVVQTPGDLQVQLESFLKNPMTYRMDYSRVEQLKSNAYGHIETLMNAVKKHESNN